VRGHKGVAYNVVSRTEEKAEFDSNLATALMKTTHDKDVLRTLANAGLFQAPMGIDSSFRFFFGKDLFWTGCCT
jgi:hypothetical protein